MTILELENIYPDAAIYVDIEVDGSHPNHTFQQLDKDLFDAVTVEYRSVIMPDIDVHGIAHQAHQPRFRNGLVMLVSPGCGDFNQRVEHLSMHCTCWYYCPEKQQDGKYWQKWPSNINAWMDKYGAIAANLFLKYS